MSINRDTIDHVAKLARLVLEDYEKELFANQMGAILTYAETLNELNTEGITPTSHAVPLCNAFRSDTVTPSLGIDGAMLNAPDRSESYFQVPPVIE